MNIIYFLKNIFGMRPKRNFTKHKFAKLSRGNVLDVDVGRYVGDSGLTDYEVFFKVKRGKIQKRCIKKNKYSNFNTLRLTPISKSAYIIVIRQDIGHQSMKGNAPPKSIWKVVLTKEHKGQRPRIIRIGN